MTNKLIIHQKSRGIIAIILLTIGSAYVDVSIENYSKLVKKESIELDCFPIQIKTKSVETIKTPSKLFATVVWHIKYYEGFRPTPYLCPAGKHTIGYGHVIDKNFQLTRVKEDEASSVLHDDFAIKLKEVRKEFKTYSKHEQYAIAMLAYNCGLSKFMDSNLLDAIKEYKKGNADAKDVQRAWHLWSKYRDPNTKKMKTSKGLLERREFEAELFLNGEDFIADVSDKTLAMFLKKKAASKWYKM